MASWNSTVVFPNQTSTTTYLGVLDDVNKYNVQLNAIERLWAAWYLWMQNDILATGIMTFVMHEVVYFGRSLPWIIIDAIPYFRRWKIQQARHSAHICHVPCIQQNPTRERRPPVSVANFEQQKIPTWREQFECGALVLFSHFTVELPQIWLFHPIATWCGLDYGVPFPAWWKMAYQIAIFFVLEDTWHYWMHRGAHWPPLYKAVHKMHHYYSAPFGMTAEYASPIEVMFLGLGTVGSPVLWVLITKDLHLFTMYMWIVLRLFQAIDSHSGYDFPWSLRHFLPFWAGAEHHDVHHEKFIGNYASSFRWWDYLMDTEAGAEAHQRRREKKLDKAKKAQ